MSDKVSKSKKAKVTRKYEHGKCVELTAVYDEDHTGEPGYAARGRAKLFK